MQTLETTDVLEIPKTVASCPYCGTKLIAQFEGFTRQPGMDWKLDVLSLDCETEPRDIGSDEWDEWAAWHSDMPYVYMLPVHSKVMDWINTHYRFNVEAT